MKPAPFDYIRAHSVAEVCDLLHTHGDDARILAGGQSLIPMLSMRLARPRVLIDINGIESLNTIATSSSAVTVGACVTQAQVSAHAAAMQAVPLVQAALPWVGHYQTRARGTLVGSIAHGDPSAELPLTLVATNANVELMSHKGTRTQSADEFYVGTMQTSMADDEFVSAVQYPVNVRRAAFNEFGRRHGDFAIVAAGAVVTDTHTTLTIGGVNDCPTNFVLDSSDLDAIDDFVNDVAWSVEARADLHATAKQRRQLVRSLGAQVLNEVLS